MCTLPVPLITIVTCFALMSELTGNINSSQTLIVVPPQLQIFLGISIFVFSLLAACLNWWESRRLEAFSRQPLGIGLAWWPQVDGIRVVGTGFIGYHSIGAINQFHSDFQSTKTTPSIQNTANWLFFFFGLIIDQDQLIPILLVFDYLQLAEVPKTINQSRTNLLSSTP